MQITADTLIEEILDLIPNSVLFLQQKGIKCISCGEPVWGSLKDAAKIKDISDEQLSSIVAELNQML